jgi:hypothetical protein
MSEWRGICALHTRLATKTNFALNPRGATRTIELAHHPEKPALHRAPAYAAHQLAHRPPPPPSSILLEELGREEREQEAHKHLRTNTRAAFTTHPTPPPHAPFLLPPAPTVACLLHTSQWAIALGLPPARCSRRGRPACRPTRRAPCPPRARSRGAPRTPARLGGVTRRRVREARRRASTRPRSQQQRGGSARARMGPHHVQQRRHAERRAADQGRLVLSEGVGSEAAQRRPQHEEKGPRNDCQQRLRASVHGGVTARQRWLRTDANAISLFA